MCVHKYLYPKIWYMEINTVKTWKIRRGGGRQFGLRRECGSSCFYSPPAKLLHQETTVMNGKCAELSKTITSCAWICFVMAFSNLPSTQVGNLWQVGYDASLVFTVDHKVDFVHNILPKFFWPQGGFVHNILVNSFGKYSIICPPALALGLGDQLDNTSWVWIPAGRTRLLHC